MGRFVFTLLAFFALMPFSTGQAYNDTLFFKSGMERPCEVTSVDERNVAYRYTTSKGNEVFPIVARKQLKYFVIYDSLDVLTFNSRQEEQAGTDTVLFVQKQDSMMISNHLLSLNPFSLGVLGLNLDYTYRFGRSGICSIYFPVRLLSPILFESTGAFYCGVGFKAFVVNEPKYSFTLAATPMFYVFDSELFGGIPFSIGFVRYLKPKLAIDGYLGAGPAFGGNINISAVAHFGIVYMPGTGRMIRIR
jgi:hypothetical protein